jgi:hypothetical protein
VYPGGEYDVSGSDIVRRVDPGDSSTEPTPITGVVRRTTFAELTPGPLNGDGGDGAALAQHWIDALGLGDVDGYVGGGGGGGAELYRAGAAGLGGAGAGSVGTATPEDGQASTGGGGGGSGDSATAGGDGGSGVIAVRTWVPQPAGAVIPDDVLINHDAQLITGLDDNEVMATWQAAPDAQLATALTAQGSPGYRAGTSVDAINGYPCVRTGLNNWFQYAAAIVDGLTEGEVFAVLASDGDPPGTPNGLWHFSASDYSAQWPWSDGNVAEVWGRATQVVVGNPTPTLTTPRIYNVVSAAGEWTVRLDGTQLYTTPTNTPSFLATAPYVGRSKDAYYFAGRIAQVMVFDRSLSAAERAGVEAYLNWHWSLGL